MKKRYYIITILLLLSVFRGFGQEKQDGRLEREVTLYNPYKPSLNEAQKRSLLPEITDTSRFRPGFRYEVNTIPYAPVYTVSPIKPAALLPDPLDKLYKSYVNIGFGNYTSPLAEVSITNERSKKGAIGFYGRHYSSNDNIKLEDKRRVFAGYMDNDVSVFGRKFFRNAVLGGSADLTQKTRHAYGLAPDTFMFWPDKKDTRLGYTNLGAQLSLASAKLDSSSFAYDFGFRYNYFFNSGGFSQNNFRFNGDMAKTFKGFYAGSEIEFDLFTRSDSLAEWPEYIFSLSPYVKKSTDQWNFKLGLDVVIERNLEESASLHLYPDLGFGFTIVPSYISFFTALTGRLEKNDPLKVINENPFIINDGTLFKLPNTSHQIVVAAGLKGNTGIEGNYLVSASYSLINDMLFYSNIVSSDSILGRGNYFMPLTDDVDLLTIHGETSGKITGKLYFRTEANIYRYTLTNFEYAWNKPRWDASLGFKYNLRDKILASVQLTALGKRKLLVSDADPDTDPLEMPAHLNLNLSAEYRYSKILSFWAKFNNISYDRYNEWAYYPAQRFMFMLGFTYSL